MHFLCFSVGYPNFQFLPVSIPSQTHKPKVCGSMFLTPLQKTTPKGQPVSKAFMGLGGFLISRRFLLWPPTRWFFNLSRNNIIFLLRLFEHLWLQTFFESFLNGTTGPSQTSRVGEVRTHTPGPLGALDLLLPLWALSDTYHELRAWWIHTGSPITEVQRNMSSQHSE